MGLVPVQTIICLELVLEDPLVGHHIGLRGPWYQISLVVGEHGLVLLHSAGVGDNVGEAATESCRWSTDLVTPTT
jgi:hypothetical protein